LENKTGKIIDPTEIDLQMVADDLAAKALTEKAPDPMGSAESDGRYEDFDLGPEYAPKKVERPTIPNGANAKRYGYYFGESALTKLALELDVPPERQQDVLRRYAKEVVEALIEGVRCPEVKGALLNLDYPTDMSVLKGQLLDLMGGLEGMGELRDLERGDFGLCQNLIVRIRNEVIRLVEQGLDEKGLERKVGVLGEYFGEGGIGKVFACRLGQGNVAAKLIKKGVGEHLVYHQYPELIEATRSSDHLVRFYGSLEFEGQAAERLDFFEELKGAVPLGDYLRLKSKDRAEDAHPVELRSLRSFLSGIYVPTLKGLGVLHDRHLVHRDIKDANILVTETEGGLEVRLGDYDLVVRSGEGGGDFSTGTIGWMSPEQIDGRNVDERSDIFSMGMLLYYGLGGPNPKGLLDYFKWAKKENHDLSMLDCPERLKALVSRCLSVAPEKRPSAKEMIDEIGEFLSDPSFEAEIEARLPEYQPTKRVEKTEMERAA